MNADQILLRAMEGCFQFEAEDNIKLLFIGWGYEIWI
jgi:hypothetical protein